jgi:DNA-binding XRE family transcriptional regulator
MTDPGETRSGSQLVSYNMRRLRKARGWRQAELGAMLGWTNVTVSNAERPRAGRRARRFCIDDVIRVAGAFGVTVEDLLAPPADCRQCKGSPPPGYTCNTCGGPGARTAGPGERPPDAV